MMKFFDKLKGTAEAVPLTVVDLCLMAAALDVFGQFLPQV